MSENDYIAEYVREKHPKLLGIGYAFWRFNQEIQREFRKYHPIVEGAPEEIEIESEEIE